MNDNSLLLYTYLRRVVNKQSQRPGHFVHKLCGNGVSLNIKVFCYYPYRLLMNLLFQPLLWGDIINLLILYSLSRKPKELAGSLKCFWGGWRSDRKIEVSTFFPISFLSLCGRKAPLWLLFLLLFLSSLISTFTKQRSTCIKMTKIHLSNSPG